MKLTGFDIGGVRHIGAIEDEKVRDLGPATAFFADPQTALATADGDIHDMTSLELAPAVPETARIFCVGINYRSHAAEGKELAGLDEPAVPMIFGRWQQSLVVDGTPVPVPPNEPGLDWEAELAVVIGRRTKHVSEADALACVAGYSAINDISLRGPHRVAHPIGEPFQWDWLASKGSDRSTPLGPGIRPAFQVENPQRLSLRLWVNGRLKQKGNTSDMVIDVAGLIAAASRLVTLEPGDVIATGTPDGVGLPRGEFLRPGDVVEMEVGDFGRLTNPVVVEEA